MDIFLNQLNQFYSTNATNFQHLTSRSTPCCPTTDYCDVTSTYVQRVHEKTPHKYNGVVFEILGKHH